MQGNMLVSNDAFNNIKISEKINLCGVSLRRFHPSGGLYILLYKLYDRNAAKFHYDSTTP